MIYILVFTTNAYMYKNGKARGYVEKYAKGHEIFNFQKPEGFIC